MDRYLCRRALYLPHVVIPISPSILPITKPSRSYSHRWHSTDQQVQDLNHYGNGNTCSCSPRDVRAAQVQVTPSLSPECHPHLQPAKCNYCYRLHPIGRPLAIAAPCCLSLSVRCSCGQHNTAIARGGSCRASDGFRVISALGRSDKRQQRRKDGSRHTARGEGQGKKPHHSTHKKKRECIRNTTTTPLHSTDSTSNRNGEGLTHRWNPRRRSGV
jgi:hypothetical protein